MLTGPRTGYGLDVRTYVTAGGKPGIWFFSLDTSSLAAIWPLEAA